MQMIERYRGSLLGLATGDALGTTLEFTSAGPGPITNMVGNETIIPQTVEGLRTFDLKTIAAGHCTGWRGLTALANAFGDKILAPSAVGKRYTF